mmetsp:Transcript_579/g.1387  ORF Transcript_579/g.1387 Transcript_579/m.1387 type:complete len:299 (-) Transcript_579:136-1032(-)
MELHLGLHSSLEEADLLCAHHRSAERGHGPGRRHQAPLHQLVIQLRDANAQPVAARAGLHRPLEHLHALHFLLHLHVRNLHSVAHFALAAQHCPRQHRPLTLDGEAVIDGEEELPRLLPGVRLGHSRHEVHHQRFHSHGGVAARRHVICTSRPCRDGHHLAILELGRLERVRKAFLHLVHLLHACLFGQHVGFVQHHQQVARGDLANYQTLCRLRLNPLVDIDHQHHDVDDLRAPEHGPYERGVARAVHQRELQLVVRQVRQGRRQVRHEAGKPEVQGDASRRALGVLVQRRRGEVRG